MPKGFTQAEKDQIQKDLLIKGKSLISEKGFKKTSVSSLTKAVGIAKGSFYMFYDSKEELFIDILEDIESQVQADMLREIEESELPADALLKKLLKSRLRSVMDNDILAMTLNTDLIQEIWTKLPEKRQRENIKRDEDFLRAFLEKKPQASKMFSHGTEKLAGIFRSLFFLILHKREIGDEAFDDVLDFMVDASVDKLFK